MSTDCSKAARSVSSPLTFPAKFLQLPASAAAISPDVILTAEPSAAAALLSRLQCSLRAQGAASPAAASISAKMDRCTWICCCCSSRHKLQQQNVSGSIARGSKCALLLLLLLLLLAWHLDWASSEAGTSEE
jgi:hypothetical protein